jgi:hypothetical protein
MQKQLILYGTIGCHLCEDAEQVLQTLGLSFESIDIMDDNALLEKFGVSIPVLEKPDGYLYWPFNEAEALAWLNNEKL